MAGVMVAGRLRTHAGLHISQAPADTWIVGFVVLAKGRAIQVGSLSVIRGFGRGS